MHLLPIITFTVAVMLLLFPTFTRPKSGIVSSLNAVSESKPPFKRKTYPGASRGEGASPRNHAQTIRVAMQVLVSIVLLVACLVVILIQSYNPADKHWAYGTAGLIAGYWLKGK